MPPLLLLNGHTRALYCYAFRNWPASLLGFYNSDFGSLPGSFLLLHLDFLNNHRRSTVRTRLRSDPLLLHLSKGDFANVGADQPKGDERRQEVVQSPVDPVF
jgi:hypothetical protein